MTTHSINILVSPGTGAGADSGFCARGVQNFVRAQNSDFFINYSYDVTALPLLASR